MNFRIICSFLFICIVCFGCTPEQKSVPLPEDTVGFQLDPNTMTLVTFKLVGEALPGFPKVVSEKNSASALFERMGISYDIKQIDQNTWVSPLRLGNSYVIGWIVEGKKLFGYCSEPFTVTKDAEITFSPGLPATVEYVVTEPPEGIEAFPAVFLLPIKTISNGNETYLSWGVSEKINGPRTIKVEGLAAGNYRLSVRASNFRKFLDERIPFLIDRRDIEVKSGSYSKFEVIYPVLDTTVEENDVTVRGTLYDIEKNPLPERLVRLIPYNEEVTEPSTSLYYPSTITDPNGNFEFLGVRPNIYATLNYGYTSILLLKESMKEGTVVPVDLIIGVNTLPLALNYPAQNLVIDLKGGSSGKLSDFAGKTVVVDFWATWNESCRKRISEINSLAEKFSGRDDIIFLELSIDYDRAVWEKAVDDYQWNQLRHGWIDLKKNIYALNRLVPFSIIIDKDGILVATGNDLDIKSELDKILDNSN
ncbi:MAG: TlpA family protein disulfide reductase [Sedimentisphaerales bacterium]|nr:TlpA family protein disulfide reductase [Sedimentisphaerales bacterium]